MSLLLKEVPVNDVKLYVKMGNEAIKEGLHEESMKWYLKGLTIAREQEDAAWEEEITNLIITLT